MALSGGAILEFDLLDAAGRCEVEANTFAAALLLDEEELQDEPEEDKVVHRDFGRLEFGRDYEIK